MNKQKNWDLYFLGMAKYISTKSKDPSTKVGAVIVNEKNELVSSGYNGFPRKMKDISSRYLNRDFKYAHIVHGELNAILFAKKDLTNCTLYTYPFLPCIKCAVLIIQTGITKVVAPKLPKHLMSRWSNSIKQTKLIFREVGIKYKEFIYE